MSSFLLATALLHAEALHAQERRSLPEFRPIRLLDRFPVIRDVPVVSANEAQAYVADNELVIGVVIEGVSRAYPVNMLSGPRREIINDTLGGHAIAATW